ncbi:rRNA pseudouridine synthase [archaeon]|nr:MAG: rRNA pseudouridine synthase [archaeon]
MNGKIVLETGTKVNIRKDQVFLDGKLVTLPDQEGIHWVVLNKPKGVVTTMKDEKDRETVLKYLPKAQELRLVPVGRLDKDSTGLLVFTNEVGWIHPLTHLSFMNSRKYQVSVRGIPSERVLDQLNVGKLISKETNDRIPKCPCFIREVDFQGNACILEITLAGISSTMLAEIAQSMNCELLGVKRIAFGSIELKGLRKGDWKELTKSEVVRLKESCMKNFVNRGTTSSEAPREAKRIGRR